MLFVNFAATTATAVTIVVVAVVVVAVVSLLLLLLVVTTETAHYTAVTPSSRLQRYPNCVAQMISHQPSAIKWQKQQPTTASRLSLVRNCC